jgi:hypothetical protein
LEDFVYEFALIEGVVLRRGRKKREADRQHGPKMYGAVRGMARNTFLFFLTRRPVMSHSNNHRHRSKFL